MSKEKEFLKAIYTGSHDKIVGSNAFMALLTEGSEFAPECCLQMGIAVFHDKPLGIVAVKGSKVSETLKKIAFAIEYADDDSNSIQEATKRILEKAPH